MEKEFSISQITDYLFVSELPLPRNVEQLTSLGVALIISMPVYRPAKVFQTHPFAFLHVPTLDTPFTRIRMRSLQRGVEAALRVIHDGGKVLVHCKAGVHRSVAMACAILIGMGYSAEEAMAIVKQKRPIADPQRWYIQSQIHKFERFWRSQHSADANNKHSADAHPLSLQGSGQGEG